MAIYTTTLPQDIYRIHITETDFGQRIIEIISTLESVADIVSTLPERLFENPGYAFTRRELLKDFDCETEKMSDNPPKFLHTFREIMFPVTTDTDYMHNFTHPKSI